MMKSRKEFEGILYHLSILGISLFFIAFEILRAARVPFTIDEASTYLNYLASNVMAVFDLNSANNHFLNTLLAKIACGLGGSSEFVLRIPNLLAYLVYLLFSFRILDRFVKNKVIVIGGYLLLNLNPYVLDFFSLCRGYGLSLGFLMAALFFFFSFLDNPTSSSKEGCQNLSRSLAAASLAVLSNFSLLNVYLSLVFFAFVFFMTSNLKDRHRPAMAPPRETQRPATKKRAALFALAAAAVLFNLLVISQDLTLAEKAYEPVAVRIPGLDDQEKQEVFVSRIDINNREKPLICEGNVWKRDEPVLFKTVKFRCQSTLLDKIKTIEISVGPKNFGFDANDIKSFKNTRHQKYSVFYSRYSMSLRRSRFPIFRPAINWKGDRIFLKALLRRILAAAGVAALVLLSVYGVGRLLRRYPVVRAEQYHPLASSLLFLAMFAGCPLYVLKTGGALWYGGLVPGWAGFIWETAFSLVNNSFYWTFYFPRQERAVLLCITLSVVVFLAVLVIHSRKKTVARVLPALSVLACLFLSAAFLVLQNLLFGNPSLFGRTGLFFIPLVMLFVIFLLSALGRLTTALKILALTLTVIVTILSLYHFYRTANTAMTVEWWGEADVIPLLDDLKTFKEKDFADRPTISLGVHDRLHSTLPYYIKRRKLSWLELHTVPPYSGCDFYFVDEARDSARRILAQMILLKTYPLSGNHLLKAKQER
jgi:hypothetical protein